VGFALYCQLLRRTVAGLKGEPLPPLIDVTVRLDFLEPAGGPAEEIEASLPPDYIEEERVRVALYRRIAEAAYGRELSDLEVEVRDRFGPLPPPAQRLLKLARLRILAAARGVQSVEVEGDKIMLQRRGQYVMAKDRFPRLRATTAEAKLDELLRHLGHRG
jgi:transcription-repair coupling factor (superfamily II helicase)